LKTGCLQGNFCKTQHILNCLEHYISTLSNFFSSNQFGHKTVNKHIWALTEKHGKLWVSINITCFGFTDPKLKIRVEEFIFLGQKYKINVHVCFSFYAIREKLMTKIYPCPKVQNQKEKHTPINFTKLKMKIIHPHAILQLNNKSTISSVWLLNAFSFFLSISKLSTNTNWLNKNCQKGKWIYCWKLKYRLFEILLKYHQMHNSYTQCYVNRVCFD